MIRSTIHGLISHVLRGVVNHNQGVQLNSCLVFRNLAYLVGGLEHEFYFSIYWEFHHPNWLIYFSIWLKPPTRHYLTMSKTGTMNRGFALGMRKNYRKTDWKASWIIFNHRIFCSCMESFSHNWNIVSFHLHFLKNFPFFLSFRWEFPISCRLSNHLAMRPCAFRIHPVSTAVPTAWWTPNFSVAVTGGFKMFQQWMMWWRHHLGTLW